MFNFLAQPAAITRVLMSYRRTRLFDLATYITMMVSCAIASSVLMIAEAAVTDGEPTISLLFPVPALVGGFRADEGVVLALQFLSALISTVALLLPAIEDRRFTRSRELAARELLAASKLDEASGTDGSSAAANP